MKAPPLQTLPADYGRSGLPSPLNQRSLRKLNAMVNAGAGPKDIAEHFDVTIRTVRRWRSILGFDWIDPPAD